ncbi:MAG: trimethylamine methyltransferase family protein [Planctomycetota bacterium]|nr:trimethylamine methyltransferase family protein [Planctomycetota bacterium]
MRPRIELLDQELKEKIIAEARSILDSPGVEIHNDRVLARLADHGAVVDGETRRARINDDLIDKALRAAPGSFTVHDALGRPALDLRERNVHFTPGSAAIHILDHETGALRTPTTRDYVDYARLVGGLEHIASQSTAFIPGDVPEKISDSYRLYLSLLQGEKPVVTGAFTIEAFGIMKDLQLAVRGTEEALREMPLTIFSCCPTAPLKWSEVTSQNVIDCAEHSIPVEFISMPLSGFVAPVTLVGTLIQHTAETLSGIVISQCARPGAPMLYGGSPAIFDVRYETTPMGAIETMMIDCACAEIGRHLGLPTQAYISLSDAKQLDAQAGLEAAMGATLAALAGINNVSGPGMLDFESCLSLEALVLDNEVCGMALRLARGIEPRDDFPARPHFEELLNEQHLLISAHTRQHLKAEHFMPGPVIDRAQRSRWREEGGLSLGERAHREVRRLINEAQPSGLDDDVKRQLTERMAAEARRHGMDRLPDHES